MSKKYPVFRIETTSFEQEPNGSNLRLYMDGEDISHAVRGFTIQATGGEITFVTIEFMAHIESNEIPVPGGEL